MKKMLGRHRIYGLIFFVLLGITPFLTGFTCYLPDGTDTSTDNGGNTNGQTGNTNTNNTQNGTQGVTALAVTVRSPSINQSLNLGSVVTVVYDVVVTGSGTVSVSAFYDRDGVPANGDEVVFATGLSTGEGKTVNLSTTGMSIGVVHFGITASAGNLSAVGYAPGVITLVGGLSVTFASPAATLNVAAGTIVPIQFSAGSANFSYQLFFDTDGTINGNEQTIGQGTSGDGATVSVSTYWDTSGLVPGTYYVGANVSNQAGAQATGYAGGTVNIVLGAFVQVLAPSIGAKVAAGDYVQIVVAANDRAHQEAKVRLFYDADNIFGNGNDVTIRAINQNEIGATWNTTGVADGRYYIGAELQNGLTPSLYSYSVAPVEISGTTGGGDGSGTTLTITVTTPATDTTIMEMSQYLIRWNTAATAATGTVTILYDRDANNDKVPDGSMVQIADDLDPALKSYSWQLPADLLGRLYIIAKLKVTETNKTIIATSRGRLIVRQQASWVGDIGSNGNGTVAGVIFRGFNFNDFAGTSFTPIADMNGDGIDDFVIVSQFGKPRLENPQGAGRGEVYLIYGNENIGRNDAGTGPREPVDLNATGQFNGKGELVGLNGVIIPGIPAEPIPPAVAVTGADLAGIPAVAAIPDQDSDSLPELVIGYPSANTARLDTGERNPGPLNKQGQFLRGGVVVVSSRNTVVSDPLWRDANGSRVLNLFRVGQLFGGSAQHLAFTTEDNWRCWPPYSTSENKYNCDDCQYRNFLNLPANVDPCCTPDRGACPCGGADGCYETIIDPGRGFTPDLVESNPDAAGGGSGFYRWRNNENPASNPPEAACRCPWLVVPPIVPGVPNDWFQVKGEPCGQVAKMPELDSQGNPTGFTTLSSGFYSGMPLEPYGMRILGRSKGDMFGSGISLVDDILLIGAPARSPSVNEVPGLMSSRSASGAVYQLKIRSTLNDKPLLYGYGGLAGNDTPNAPKPYQYIAIDGGSCGLGGDAGPQPGFTVVGARSNDMIGYTVMGVDDVNGDFLGDVLIGCPEAFKSTGTTVGDMNNSGGVYLIYRRTTSLIEGDYDLAKLELDPLDRERLNGVLVRGRAGEKLGYSLAPGFDLNGDGQTERLDLNQDGLPDILIGNQNYRGAGDDPSADPRGEVVVLFGNRNLISPEGGFTIDDLVAQNYGAVIRGENNGDMAGFNVSYAGDFDGDGKADWTVSAPKASPAVDINGDGAKETLAAAGTVYVIFGSNKITPGSVWSLSQLRTGELKGVIFNGYGIGDQLGGGEAPSLQDDPTYGYGMVSVRSRGLTWAGDVNKDGFADILVGAPSASPYGKTRAGEVYLIFGFAAAR